MNFKYNTSLLKCLFWFVVVPIVIYFSIFCVYTFPAIKYFSTRLYADMADGLVYYWNLWWVHKAVTQVHTTIWQTKWLYYPYGIYLYAHALVPLNGFVTIFFWKFLTLLQIYNSFVIASYIMTGLFTFYLAYSQTKSYLASVIAGFMFTFSSYRIAHTEGHMEFISTQWLPLFLLIWTNFVNMPNVLKGIVAAVVLYFNLLTTPYYFIFASMTAMILVAIKIIDQRKLFIPLFHKQKSNSQNKLELPQLGPKADVWVKKIFIGITAFLVTFVIVAYSYVYPLLQNQQSDFAGHDPTLFSTDLLAPFVPSAHSRFANLTKWYWQKLPGNIHESSVYVGFVALIIFVLILVSRAKLNFKAIKHWYILVFIFFTLSLGPVLHIGGIEVTSFFLPYSLVEAMPIFLKSGVPVRMMVIVMLSMSVIAAFGFSMLLKGAPWQRILAFVLMAVLSIEYLPRQLTLSSLSVPQYVFFLKNQENNAGVIDLVANPSLRMYYQTVHEKPVQFGYLSRIPKSTVGESVELQSVIDVYDYSLLYNKYNFKYWVSPSPLPKTISCPQVVYQDVYVWIYDLAVLTNCQ